VHRGPATKSWYAMNPLPCGSYARHSRANVSSSGKKLSRLSQLRIECAPHTTTSVGPRRPQSHTSLVHETGLTNGHPSKRHATLPACGTRRGSPSRGVAVQVARFERRILKPVFHFIGARVETRRLSATGSYGSGGVNVHCPAAVVPVELAEHAARRPLPVGLLPHVVQDEGRHHKYQRRVGRLPHKVSRHWFTIHGWPMGVMQRYTQPYRG
jgi:hypothetical protein